MAFGNHNQLIKRFGCVVEEMRKASGYSQRQLADLADIGRTQLDKVEKGTSKPTLTTMVKVASAFNIKLSTLIKTIE